MSFHAIEKGTWKPQKKARAVNRVSFSTASKDGASLVFSLSGDLYDKLGKPRRVKVLLGSGEHKGKILLKGARDGEANTYSLAANKEGYIRKFTISRHRLGLGTQAARYKSTTTNHRMTDEGLMVWLPE